MVSHVDETEYKNQFSIRNFVTFPYINVSILSLTIPHPGIRTF